MQKAILVYNTMSGNRSIPQNLNHILARFQEHGILLQPYRLYDEGWERLPQVLMNNDYSFIIASGGDGTLNSIVSILLKNDIRIPIGIIPAGTCNDLARSLDIPAKLDPCLDVILSGKLAEIDVGVVNENSYFLSTCAGGIFVSVSFSTNNELKKNFGSFAYYLKALSEVTNIKPFRLELQTENKKIEEDALLFLVLNGKHGAGFSNLIKEADLSDGLMDIVIVKNCSHIDLAGMFFKVLANDWLNNKNVTALKAKTCIVNSENEIPTTVDGEKGPGLPLSIRFLNKAIKVFVKE
ncbi:MAG: YegS/Rv2252/BmrU family lipid kinase [Bacillota bacterium]|nr:YegS/Rv2252/BmrU family lipid kinase [Bacillota bacterium]